MSAAISTEFPQVTLDNFENFLTSDDLFVHVFNTFLSLPSFPQALLYNQETEQFEVASRAAEITCNTIRTAFEHSKSQLITNGLTKKTNPPAVDNHYTVSCLDREQGIQWIRKERLPYFLQSSCYHEYRISKVLFQREHDLNIPRRTCSSCLSTRSPTRCDKGKNNVLNPHRGLWAHKDITAVKGCVGIHHPVSSDRSRKMHTNCSESSRCSSNFSKRSFCFSSSSTSNLKCACIDTPETSAPSGDKQLQEEVSELHVDHLAEEVVKRVIEDALSMLTAQSQANATHLTHNTNTDRCCKCKAWSGAFDEKQEEHFQEFQRSSGWKVQRECEKTLSEGRWSRGLETDLDICCYGTCCQGNKPGIDGLKEFLRGTPGGKLLNLWLDIERLKTIQNGERKNSFLDVMRSRYLRSGSQNCLNRELLATLWLTTSLCWTEERLCAIQSNLTESLISYWFPRYWTSPYVQKDVELWREWCVSPSYALMTPVPLSTTSGLGGSLHAVHMQQPNSGRCQSLDCTIMEKMLHALFVDPHAGSYFTHFCEQSGNQRWENAVYFWIDLQHYHELFYQDGLDPYRVQRVAQLLYSKYLFSSARRSIGVTEEVRTEVYDKLMPAFEELFDQVEEHTLNILMEAWTVLVDTDKDSFLQVRVRKVERCVDSWEYRELQSLSTESKPQMQQVEQDVTAPYNTSSELFSQGKGALNSWSNVPRQYQGYRLGSLLRHRHEIWHFMSFLQNKDASIHLECWLDLEQYRRTPPRNKAAKEDRSSRIANRYLNRKYFFSIHSPATAEQQSNILHLAGGRERLKLDCLSNEATVTIQDIIRSHIEKTWLPEFLATAEFIERQKHKPKPSYQGHKTRKEGWKSQGLWMSSSKEILLFRQLLLSPASCLQFQHFVSVKGDFLENDVLFWQEVQRYKDLCHSHSTEATIQQKISTIINCFINSSTPPALQIDIPLEQAQHILDKRHELGPYIFREAQMSVFSELLRFWPEFQELRRSVQAGHLQVMLQDKRAKHKARVRRQRRKEEEEEERRAQAELKQKDSSSSESEDMDNQRDRGGGSEKQLSTTQRNMPLYSTEPLSWSYSKYMAVLKREETLLRRQSQKEASFSTYSVSSDGSVRSRGSKQSRQHPSRNSSSWDDSSSPLSRMRTSGIEMMNGHARTVQLQ
ncbi:regulator of G-protein signaling 22 [Dunckerocampus dactyliophorus]|uniref:regulator of G-protein signaling 22 n=1 Tax=Dunckerocampus dactyliophorus TaxID=161453 RepID=UPI002406F17C|nr:regulator of G-protein signaling 22 [Dunckerocampus dactyliophorus]